MNLTLNSLYDPLMSPEEFNKLVENGSDSDLWEVICIASLHDVVLGRCINLMESSGMSRHRTLMMAIYFMVLRNKEVMDKYVEAMGTLPVGIKFQPRFDDKGKLIDVIT